MSPFQGLPIVSLVFPARCAGLLNCAPSVLIRAAALLDCYSNPKTMNVPPSIIQADFDRLALLADRSRDHNGYYDDFLLKHMPSPCAEALEIGCGTGIFSRRLARRSTRVLALDLSPQMIRIARGRSAP